MFCRRALLACAAPALLLFLQSAALGQGNVNFNNRVTGSVGIIAPVYGVEPGLESTQMRGNATTNGGSLDYHGPLLLGTGFTAELFYGPEGTTDESLLVSCSTATFRTAAALKGFITPPPFSVPIPLARVTMQLRAWDNKGGTLTNWAMAVADGTVARGSSALTPTITPAPWPGTPANLTGLTSFNLVLSSETGGFLIDQQPQNATVGVGGSASFSVHLLSSNPSNTFQWRFNGNNISGATGTSLSVSNAAYTDEGNYDVVVTAPLYTGSTLVRTSSVARLVVTPNLLNIEYALVEPFGISAVRLTYTSTPGSTVALEAKTSPPGLHWVQIDSASSMSLSNYFYDVFATNLARIYRLRRD